MKYRILLVFKITHTVQRDEYAICWLICLISTGWETKVVENLFLCYTLDRPGKKIFDEMFSIPHLYNSACSHAANPILIRPILMSIIFHHYKKTHGTV